MIIDKPPLHPRDFKHYRDLWAGSSLTESDIWQSVPAAAKSETEAAGPAKILVYSYRDSYCDTRLEKLSSILERFEILHASQESMDILISKRHQIDVLVVSGDDVRRITSNFLNRNFNLVNQKVSFSISSQNLPKRRSQLLRLGFDDTFTCNTPNKEIALRIFAMSTRAFMYSLNSEARFEHEFENFCSKHVILPLGSGDRRRLKTLYQNVNKVVPYTSLASYDFATDSYSFQSLKVQISKLRRKLSRVQIVAVPSSGYCLVVNE
jgi:hypothetical protein